MSLTPTSAVGHRPMLALHPMKCRHVAPTIPGVAFELFDTLARQARWLRTAGLDQGDLEAAAEFAGDLVRRAEDLRSFLDDDLSRRSRRRRSTRSP